ncbi:hypothetical protein [Candidatus Methylobacter oryzae]|uniref:hypothetical protein n=1 Tax=Candidatus Methylobacter oryzae TaxID=2497749 RepID=UPI0012B50F37|nr:hypothetical protein [Candidatus Methylobacter oryzae]
MLTLPMMLWDSRRLLAIFVYQKSTPYLGSAHETAAPKKYQTIFTDECWNVTVEFIFQD